MAARSLSDKVGMTLIHMIFILFSIACIIPLIMVISISFSSEQDLMQYGYGLIPRQIDFTAYQYILDNPKQIINSYMVTMTVTLVGTFLSLLINTMIAYALSKPDFKYRNKVTFYLFFTMLFGGGLVPWYMLIRNYLHLSDTLWVLILPSLSAPWYIFILRTFFSKIPIALSESAKIDGAREFYIYWKIVLPLSKPALATVGLFFALGYWNDWWLCLMFIDKGSLINLQYMLHRIMANINFLQSALNSGNVNIDVTQIPTESARMAMLILSIGPMLFLLTFLQKHFVKGLTIGAVKG
jgi:putative aldouronate transport system permease protein